MFAQLCDTGVMTIPAFLRFDPVPARGAPRKLGQLDRIAELLGRPNAAAPDFEALLDRPDLAGRRKAVEADTIPV